MFLNDLSIGAYQLSFELPSDDNLTFNFTVSSSDSDSISIKHTLAFLSNNFLPVRSMAANSFAQIVIEPRNNYNESIDALRFYQEDFDDVFNVNVKLTNLQTNKITQMIVN